MTTSSGRRGYLLLLILLMLLCILMEQYWIARFVPFFGALGSVQPMLVFLDIPLRLPVIDWLPVGILLTAGYLIAISPDVTRYHPNKSQLFMQKAAAVFTAWWVLLISILVGGGLFMLLGDQLPKGVYNGLDSFGLRADIQLPWFYPVVYHLHGSMFIGVTFSLGMSFLSRQASIMIPVEAPATAPGVTTITKQPAAVTIRREPAQQTLRTSVAALAERSTLPDRPATTVQPAFSATTKRETSEPAVAGPHSRPGFVDRYTTDPAEKRSTGEQSMADLIAKRGAYAEPAAKRGPAVLPPAEKRVVVTPPPQRPAQPQKPRVAPGFVSVVAPQAPGKGTVYPCIVLGALKPV